MPKYWGGNYFAHGRFPEVGQKQKTEKKEEERLNDGKNNGQATHGARKPPGPIFIFICLVSERWSRYVFANHTIFDYLVNVIFNTISIQ